MTDETIVETATFVFGSSPRCSAILTSQSISRTPISFPERRTYSPLWGIAVPMRSASGSVATTRFGFTLSARSRASCSASRNSGFGYLQVGKLPSGSFCSGTTSTSFTPISFRMRVTHSMPVPLSGVYTTL